MPIANLIFQSPECESSFMPVFKKVKIGRPPKLTLARTRNKPKFTGRPLHVGMSAEKQRIDSTYFTCC